jgi:hypothetical protein
MLWLRWAFIVVNLIYCLMAVIWSRSTSFNRFGKLTSASPYLWQLIGVGLVVLYGFSAWHLLWWFAVGYMLMLTVVSIMSRMGHNTLR